VDAATFAWTVVVLVGAVFVIISVFEKRSGGRGGTPSPGAGAYGSIYDLLNQDKRNAIEMIVEDKAAWRDPEDADGNLPDLANPTRPQKR
jgi:hypothetical protein